MIDVVIAGYPVGLIGPGFVELTHDFPVSINGVITVVPAGTYSNLGTVPWFMRWLISRCDPCLMIPSILHDYQSGESGPDGVVDWRLAARNLRAMMWHYREADPAPQWWVTVKREAVYRGVMLNGILTRRASV